MMFFFFSVAVTAGLSFVAVMVWLSQRHAERKEHYRGETMKKIAESGSAAAALEYARELDRMERARQRDGMRLGGLITMAAGVGLTVFAYGIEKNEPVYLIGLIPTLIGAAIFGFAVVRRVD
jgi:hypothetical protein